MQFHFKGTHANGEIYEGDRTASDKVTLFHELKKEGVNVISVEEIRGVNLKAKLPSAGILGRVSTHEKISFARNMGLMIKAGLPISRVLQVMGRQSRNPKLKTVLTALEADINKGKSLSDALAAFPKVFSPIFVFMAKAGEESGNLSESFNIVSNQLEKAYLLQKKVQGAFIYPGIIFTLMIGIGILALVYIVPTLTATFTELKITLPLSTRMIIFVSEFLKNHFLLFFMGLGVSIAGFISLLRTQKGSHAADFVVLHIPMISELVKHTNAARTARTLSSLLSSGVPVVQAVQITEDVIQNSYYKPILRDAAKTVERGEPIATIFSGAEKLYPPFVGEMTAVGEETGELPKLLFEVASYYENEVDQKTKDMSTIIEPFLMIVIGLAVGFFAVSMISPIYSITDAIK